MLSILYSVVNCLLLLIVRKMLMFVVGKLLYGVMFGCVLLVCMGVLFEWKKFGVCGCRIDSV